MPTTGGWGILPSKCRKGRVVSPPTVTVRERVPPSLLVAPRVTPRPCVSFRKLDIQTMRLKPPSAEMNLGLR
jgi:hypothetical protein